MTGNVAQTLKRKFLPISCGIGTSAATFEGYKYPNREATEFSKYYSEASVILLDEFTALDPAVAQVVNSALANGFIQTTTGQVFRHPDCIIVATSNSFGTGASREYVANNQLDASTLDRFTGGILKVDYSKKFESQYDTEVVSFVYALREFINVNGLRRVASTRMIQQGERLKKKGKTDWKQRLVINWTDTERNQLQNWFNRDFEKEIISINDKLKEYTDTITEINISLSNNPECLEDNSKTKKKSPDNYNNIPYFGSLLHNQLYNMLPHSISSSVLSLN